jgi:hypothetical protein
MAAGFFGESSAFFTNAPVAMTHNLILVKTFEAVMDGDIVLLPIPVPTPAVMPAAAKVAAMPLLWGKSRARPPDPLGRKT